MATQLQISSRFQQNGMMSLSSTSLSSCLSPKKSDVFFMIPKERRENGLVMKKNKKGIDGNEKKRLLCSKVETVEVVVGEVTEVDKDTFWPLVNAADDKIVVLDMYTQWCGPCKIIAPKFKELAQKYSDVVFLKLDCNKDNKALAKELGIKVVPTFKILKDGKIVSEVTGAKIERIVSAIEDVRST
ncbi:thioredoxin F2, chloroplastic-like [Apium graveolens]|uniref:thioredoxin F2, chloroplastic-like n=1 Tax=Apium graveolens TaxID=4045 RepID=UPI003D7B0041